MGKQSQRFANGLPLIVGGDFNIQPSSAQYQLITNGSLPLDHPQNPESSSPVAGLELKFDPMRSVYALAAGKEPEFTNLAFSSRSSEKFIETLDYIWVSPEWHVSGVKQLASKASMQAVMSFPSKDEPS